MRTQWHTSSIIPNLVNSILCCNDFIRINYRASTSINTRGSCCVFVVFGCLWHTQAHEKWNAATIKGRGEVCWAITSTWLIAQVIYKIYSILQEKVLIAEVTEDINCSLSLCLIILLWASSVWGWGCWDCAMVLLFQCAHSSLVFPLAQGGLVWLLLTSVLVVDGRVLSGLICAIKLSWVMYKNRRLLATGIIAPRVGGERAASGISVSGEVRAALSCWESRLQWWGSKCWLLFLLLSWRQGGAGGLSRATCL